MDPIQTIDERNTRHSNEVSTLMQKVMLSLKAEGFVDDKENQKLVEHWMEGYHGSSPASSSSDIVVSLETRIATFTGEVKEMISAYSREVRLRIVKYSELVVAETKGERENNKNENQNRSSDGGAKFGEQEANNQTAMATATSSLSVASSSDGSLLLDGESMTINLSSIDLEIFGNPQQSISNNHSESNSISTNTEILPPDGARLAANKVKFAILNWIESCTGADTPTKYNNKQGLQIFLKLEAMLRDLRGKVDTDVEWVRQVAARGHHPSNNGNSTSSNTNNTTTTTSATELLEYVIAAFIYSVDAKECACLSLEDCQSKQLEDAMQTNHKNSGGVKKHRTNPPVPANPKVLGWNGTHWAQMNWVLRVAADANAVAALDTDSRKLLKAGLDFYEPLRLILDAALTVLPKKPRVVFRGVGVPVAHKYHLGTEVTFAPFSSTSLEGAEALKFMSTGRGGTYFVISTHSGALIEDFSHYPEQAEALLKTNTGFVVTSKMSKTLLQMLGNDFDVVFMTEKGSPLGPKAQIQQLVEGVRTTEFVYDGYRSVYVEGRVSLKPPPPPPHPASTDQTPTDSKPSDNSEQNQLPQERAEKEVHHHHHRHHDSFPLYKATEHFVEADTTPYMFLLGSGGAGKTSALVGALCHLMRRKTRHSKPLLPLFVSLPSVGSALYEQGGLDSHLQLQLRLDDATFESLLQETRVVLLLDSLDEVAPRGGNGGSRTEILNVKFLSLNPWCARAKVIVSCRTEFLELGSSLGEESKGRKEATLTLSFGGVLHNTNRTLVYHVLPFNEIDRQKFMRQAAADRIEELANKEAEAQFNALQDKFRLGSEELSHPCLLRIATVVVRSEMAEKYKAIRNMYSLYNIFVQMSLQKYDHHHQANSNENENDDDDDNFSIKNAIISALETLALEMCRSCSWQVPVSRVRQVLAGCLDIGGGNSSSSCVQKSASRSKPNEKEHVGSKEKKPIALPSVDDILNTIPARCEDLHNDHAMWTFWHKTIAEFLVARYLRNLTMQGSKKEQKKQPPSRSCDMKCPECRVKILKIKIVNLDENVCNVCEMSLSHGGYRCKDCDYDLCPGCYRKMRSKRQASSSSTSGAVATTPQEEEEKSKPDNSNKEGERLQTTTPRTTEQEELFVVERQCKSIFATNPVIKEFYKLSQDEDVTLVLSDYNENNYSWMDALEPPPPPPAPGESFMMMMMNTGSVLPRKKAKKWLSDEILAKISPNEVLHNLVTLDMSSCDFENTPLFAEVAPLKLVLQEFEVLENLSLPRIRGTTIGIYVKNEGSYSAEEYNDVSKIENFDFRLVVPNSVKFLDMTESFPQLQKIYPKFLSFTKNLEVVRFPRHFINLEHIPSDFCHGCSANDIGNLLELPIHVLAIEDNFMRDMKNLTTSDIILPGWTKVKKIGHGFFQNSVIKTFAIPCEKTEVVDLSKNAEGVKISYVPKVAEQMKKNAPAKLFSTSFGAVESIGRYFLSSCSVETISLPPFDSLLEVGHSFLHNLPGLKSQDLDISHCFPLLKVAGDYCFAVIGGECTNIKFPPFPSLEKVGNFCFHKLLNVTAIDLSQSFASLEETGYHFLSGNDKATAIKLPPFPELIKLSENILADCRSLESLDASHCFPKLEKLVGCFMRYSKACREVKLPSFQRLDYLGGSFMEECGVEHLDLSHCFEKVEKIECNVLAGTKKLKSIKLPPFDAVKELGSDFLTKTGVVELDLSQSFKNLQEIETSFSCEAGFLACSKIEKLTLPSFDHVSVIPNFFLYNLENLKDLRMGHCFANATEIRDQVLYQLSGLNTIELPKFEKVEFIGEKFLAASGLNQKSVPSFVDSFPKMLLQPKDHGFCDEIEGGMPTEKLPQRWVEAAARGEFAPARKKTWYE